MISNMSFLIIVSCSTVFFIWVLFKANTLKHVMRLTIAVFLFFLIGIFVTSFFAKQEIQNNENEITKLVSLLHSEIDSIECISTNKQKYDFIKHSDEVLTKIDSLTLQIKNQEAYTDINIDERIMKVRKIVCDSKKFIESLNDTLRINNLTIGKRYLVTDEEMSVQQLPLSNSQYFSFLLKIYDDKLRNDVKAIYITDNTNFNFGETYQYKNKQNHFVLPRMYKGLAVSYNIGILTYNETSKTYTYYYIKVLGK